jgi:pimeloyl-ACP methyl ester carboxylesterase
MATCVLVHRAWHSVDMQTGLDEAIASLAQFFGEREISDAILVGHSYGGMAITGAADSLPPGKQPDGGLPMLLAVFREALMNDGDADQAAHWHSKMNAHPYNTFYDKLSLSKDPPEMTGGKSYVYCLDDSKSRRLAPEILETPRALPIHFNARRPRSMPDQSSTAGGTDHCGRARLGDRVRIPRNPMSLARLQSMGCLKGEARRRVCRNAHRGTRLGRVDRRPGTVRRCAHRCASASGRDKRSAVVAAASARTLRVLASGVSWWMGG